MQLQSMVLNRYNIFIAIHMILISGIKSNLNTHFPLKLTENL